jgi:hypothetical protein
VARSGSRALTHRGVLRRLRLAAHARTPRRCAKERAGRRQKGTDGREGVRFPCDVFP